MMPYRWIGVIAALALAAPTVVSAQEAQVRLTAATSAVPAAAVPLRDSAIAELEEFLEKYPESPLRPNALFQLGELLVRRADEQFAEAQRSVGGDTTARSDAPVRPRYEPAIARYEELVRRFPDFPRMDAAAYTLGTLYAVSQRYADAASMFERVATREDSPFRAEAYFRLGDAYFELAAQARGTERRAMFGRAASAYEQAVRSAERGGDIYFLALYKLGWSYYNQATQTNQDEYRRAVETFGELVAEYDKLTEEQQSRLGLRGEAIEYMAIAFTQVGGAAAANEYFERRGGAPYRLTVLRRVAVSLRDQGDFPRAVEAYRAIIAQAPSDTSALSAQREIVDIYQNRMLEPDSAQRARLELVDRFAPGTPWAAANAALMDTAQAAREEALRQSAQYLLSQAQTRRDPQRFASAAQLYERYVREFPTADSARVAHLYFGEALFGQREYARAGAQYAQAAYGYNMTDSLAQVAGRNAIVAFDSALVRSKTDRALQDSLFSAVDRFVAAFPESNLSKQALIQKGRRASETERWDVLAQTFRTYAERYPNDPYTPTAQKLVGDALYKQGQYAEAQTQWEAAQQVAAQAGRRSLADSIARLRTGAASEFADTLVARGEYRRAAEEVYVALADKNPQGPNAPGALRDAIETYMLADSAARARGDEAASRQARERAVELSHRLVTTYPRYEYRLQYQTLRANLLADLGRREEAAEALRELITQNRDFRGRADAMIRLGVTLDTLGRDAEAAAALIDFSQAYPRDERAPDAHFTAAALYLEAGDTTQAARTYGEFARRFPRDTRVADARRFQVNLLRAGGDTTAANAELARICSGRVPEEMRGACAEQVARRNFERGVAMWPRYQAEALVIRTPAQLTRTGVERASREKQRLLREMTAHFRRAIEAGNPDYLAAATYYVGLAQHEYGNFLRNVQLPEQLSAEEAEAARQGSARQAQEFYDAARSTWQALIEKAEQENIRNVWIERAREALSGNVPSTPPTSSVPALHSPVVRRVS